MKKTIFFLNLFALIVATIWYVNSGYDYEPLIALVTLSAALIGLFFTFNFSRYLRIKGNRNITLQKSNNSSGEIDGDENITIQE